MEWKLGEDTCNATENKKSNCVKQQYLNQGHVNEVMHEN